MYANLFGECACVYACERDCALSTHVLYDVLFWCILYCMLSLGQVWYSIHNMCKDVLYLCCGDGPCVNGIGTLWSIQTVSSEHTGKFFESFWIHLLACSSVVRTFSIRRYRSKRKDSTEGNFGYFCSIHTVISFW